MRNNNCPELNMLSQHKDSVSRPLVLSAVLQSRVHGMFEHGHPYRVLTSITLAYRYNRPIEELLSLYDTMQTVQYIGTGY
jgi:hypothetical protein